MNITLTDTVDHVPSGLNKTITVEATADNAVVKVMHGELNSHLDTTTTMPWEHIEDMEFLSKTFQYELVCVFRVIVVLLGKAYNVKDI